MTGQDFLDGQLLLIDKPLEWTSFQVVNKVRWLIRKQFGFKKIKVGHAGTLDPLASGLLLICTGKFTKRITEFQAQHKEYTGTFTLGATRPSFDMETEIDQEFDLSGLTEAAIEAATQQFLGTITQYPPIFSAVKQDGKRLYELARKGQQTEIKPREVEILHFSLSRIAPPEVDFIVQCSKGTYIRSLANDFGKALDNGAYLSALRRTKIGDYSLEDAMGITTFEDYISSL
ncbi:tRNA pseudouridine(55) synthase TruB [Gilvibacter sp.]|uniref:tRNA pseudouridine(55) synthase TruB n=1 Tax=Gilvibacter sp. TaxID=2729997 RepID=UPI0035BE60D1